MMTRMTTSSEYWVRNHKILQLWTFRMGGKVLDIIQIMPES